MIEQIAIDKIKPSPYQPRLSFDLEDIRGSILKDGVLVALTVRKKNGFYELIDGERRLRLAKDLGYKNVKCDVIDVNDETARRMVWKVNTLRKDYTPKEKAYHFRKLQESGMSLRAIARECDYEEHTVAAHLNVFKLPQKYQDYIWDNKISVSHIQELGAFFNGSALDNAVKYLDQILDRKLTSKELRDTIKPELEEIERKRVESAKKAVGKITTEVKEPKSPEELEKAAEALRREAERRKTAERKAEEKRQKLIAQAQKSLNSVTKKIDGAEKIINVGVFRERLSEIKKSLKQNPAEIREQLISLGKEVDGAKKQRQKEIEEEQRKKHEDAIRRKAEEETKQKLLHDKDFVDKILASTPKTISAIPEAVIQTLSKEQREQVIKAFAESEAELAKRKGNPALIQRGNLVKNWMAHTEVAGLGKSLACPVCNADFGNLVWKCHKLSITKAQAILKAELEEK